MARKLLDRLTYANVIASIALFVALGGSGYAAVRINGKNIKNKSISGKKLKNRTITNRKLKKNTLGGAEINESKLGRVGDAERADTAIRADDAAHAGTADDAGTIDGIDSSALARRSDGAGFLVQPGGWKSSSATGTVFTGQTDFVRASAGSSTMSLPLSYPTRSNGRPLRITAVRVCRSTTNATITAYGISTGSGASPANGGDSVTVSRTGAGCDVVDMASMNGGAPFRADGDVTLDLLVQANFASGTSHVALGAAQLTLVPG